MLKHHPIMPLHEQIVNITFFRNFYVFCVIFQKKSCLYRWRQKSAKKLNFKKVKNHEKLLSVILIAVMLLSALSACTEDDFGDVTINGDDTESTLKVGMSCEDALAIIGEDNCFAYLGHYFFERGDKNVVVMFDGSASRVEKIEEFDKVSATKEDFSKITVGMTVFEVVKLVGIPFASYTSGLATTEFKATNGETFRIQWRRNINEDMKVLDIIETELTVEEPIKD